MANVSVDLKVYIGTSPFQPGTEPLAVAGTHSAVNITMKQQDRWKPAGFEVDRLALFPQFDRKYLGIFSPGRWIEIVRASEPRKSCNIPADIKANARQVGFIDSKQRRDMRTGRVAHEKYRALR